MKQLIGTILLTLIYSINILANNPPQQITGIITDQSGEPLVGASVSCSGTTIGVTTDAEGKYQLCSLPNNATQVEVSYLGYLTQKQRIKNKTLNFILVADVIQMNEVEVVGKRFQQTEKLDLVTRIPLRYSEQLQSISVISNKVIAQQGNMTLADATKNVAGLSTFATYGGASESLSTRGFRGVPILKNGIRIHSDFRGQGSLTDMQGIESIQVVKGAAAVTQGIGNDLGSAGGTVNIATKTPQFKNKADVSLRVGSWGQVRPTFDLQTVAGAHQKVALRLNGAFERSDSYRKGVSKDRIYLNPSLAWQLNPRAQLILEMDYLHDSRTPDRGTVNLAPDSIYALYSMPHNKFLGFDSDRLFTNQLSYAMRYNQKLSPYFSLRAAFVGATLDVDNTSSSVKRLYSNKSYNMQQRSLGRSLRNDANQAVQFDLIGQDLHTGKIKHTFQLGVDFKRNVVGTTAYKSIVVDTIDVLNNIPNTLPRKIKLTADDPKTSTAYSYGVMLQDVITFNRYLKAIMGARYSYGNSFDSTSDGAVTGNAFNPMLGIIVSPLENIHLFGSYTNTTSLQSATNLKEDGTPVGASTTEQFEAGVKSEWLNKRLHLNLTLFHVMNNNLSYALYDDADQTTGRYGLAGDLKRQGVEVELTGNILPNLQAIIGYAFLDAQYKKSPAYVDGSAPMNAPKHTANGWLHYTVHKSCLRGLSIGIGTYYIGKRPVNDFTKKTTHANSSPGMNPFDLKAYTTLNATLGYRYKKAGVQLVLNNILNTEGYSSYYRGGFINPIDPFNFATNLTYSF